jgi:energy-coupling factor transporter ATP-binding protein EcfA2
MHVRKLFGAYDYELKPNEDSPNLDKLMILYGDNGSGKTTILKCLFHLLAPDEGQGHKTKVVTIPFKRFEIRFGSGEKVWAERKGPSVVGTYSMSFQSRDHKRISYDFVADENLSIEPRNDEQRIQLKTFLASLRELGLSLFFLSDDRTVRFAGGGNSTPKSESAADEDLLILREPSEIVRMRGGRPQVDSESIAQRLLVESFARAQSWIQTQVLRGSSVGESSVNSLYNEILKRLSTLPAGESLQPEISKRVIEDRVKKLESRSREYAKYGLVPEFDGKLIISALSDSKVSQMSIVSNVLTPYLDSVERKLDALERIYSELNTFVNVINSFFRHKIMRFEMHKGFEITIDSGKLLPPQALSSGERHLLLLFLNTITAFERPSLFIIDEPEISLNIKWQRKLLSSLLECVGDNPVQYVFATHSVELLAQHRNNVLKLA